MTPVIQPNLPTGPVVLAAVSARAPAILAALRGRGTEVLEVPAAPHLPQPTTSHADLQLLHLGHKRVLLAQEATHLATPLAQFGFEAVFCSKPLGDSYPSDISLNFLLLQNACFGLCSHMPLQLKEYCNNAGLQIVNAKQGYARCSVAVVAKNAVMTADKPLAGLFTAAGLDVLLLPPGGILLDGYGYGFLGGCCGLLDKDKLAFAGSLEQYEHGQAVLEFLAKHRVQPVYLQNGKLLDIGGILPLAQSDA